MVTGSGDDTINGGSGSDVINAGNGDNAINAGSGNNRVAAGKGDDTVRAGSGSDRINVGSGDNVVNAGEGNNVVASGGGEDRIRTGRGNDNINAGDGDDWIDGGAGGDRIVAGAGDDTIRGGAGADVIDAGSGDDVAVINVSENAREGRDDTIQGGSGDDTLRLELTEQQYESGSFDDALFEVKDFLADVQDGTVGANATGHFEDLSLRAGGFESVELAVDGRTVDLNRKPVVLGVNAVQIDFSQVGEPVEATPAQGPDLIGEDGAQILDESAGDVGSGSNAGDTSSDKPDNGDEATTTLLPEIEISDDDREDKLESATVTIDNLGEGAEVLFDAADTGIDVKIEHLGGGGVQITFAGSADPAAYTSVLQSVEVKNDTVSQDGGTHEIRVTVEDEHGVVSDPASAGLEIIEDPNAALDGGSEQGAAIEDDEAGDTLEGGTDADGVALAGEDDAEEESGAETTASNGGTDGETGDGSDETQSRGSEPASDETDPGGVAETVSGDIGDDDVGDFDGGDEEDFALYAELDGGTDNSPDWMTVSEQPADDALVSSADEAAASADDWTGGDTVEVNDSAAADDLDSSIQISTLV